MAFAGGRKHLSGSSNISCRRESTYFIWRTDLFFYHLFRHGIQNPGEHDILFHPDAIRAFLPFGLPETD